MSVGRETPLPGVDDEPALLAVRREAVTPNAEEEEALQCLARYMDIVWHGWNMRVNSGEQTAAVHVLQGAVIQHMLHRAAPDRWGSWWADAERSEV